MREEAVKAYPLCWPAGQPRCKHKARSRFKTTPDIARIAMIDELHRLGVERVIVSTNVELRLDGAPYANRKPPVDTGVAVYWTDPFSRRQLCIACDQYREVYENMRAIQHTVEALRTIQRHGGSQLLERAFTGFAALPAPMECAAPWYEVLGVTPEASEVGIREARMRLAKRFHPDSGSEPDAEKMKAVNAAADTGISIRRGD